MKTRNYGLAGAAISLLLMLMTSCEHGVNVESLVYADGSLDRTVVLSKTDSNAALENMFGISASKGWEVEVTEDSSVEGDKKIIVFRKHFGNVEEANTEMDGPVDSLFRISSGFEKRFLWFYTYIKFSDTYRAINLFTDPEVSDYFTPEDFAFIERLPAEGEPISHADSIYMVYLNQKIFDLYAQRGLYNAFYAAMIRAVGENHPGQQWIDTLEIKRDELFGLMMGQGNDFEKGKLLEFADSLGIPLTAQLREDYERFTTPVDSRLKFMSVAVEGNYRHQIQMPWTVIQSNADSVAGNELYWHPPVARFLLKDYTMYAESRRMNYWAVIISLLIVAFTLLLLFRKNLFRTGNGNRG